MAELKWVGVRACRMTAAILIPWEGGSATGRAEISPEHAAHGRADPPTVLASGDGGALNPKTGHSSVQSRHSGSNPASTARGYLLGGAHRMLLDRA